MRQRLYDRFTPKQQQAMRAAYVRWHQPSRKYRHDEVAGRAVTQSDVSLADFIEAFLRAAACELSRTQISAFLGRAVRSRDIAFALHLLHHTCRADRREVPSAKHP